MATIAHPIKAAVRTLAKSGGGSSHRKLTADQKMQQKQFNPYTEEDFVYDDGEGVDFSEKSKHGGHGKDKHGRSGRVAVDPLAQFGVSNMHSESRHRDFDFPGVPDSSHRSKTGAAGKLEPLSKSAACARSGKRARARGSVRWYKLRYPKGGWLGSKMFVFLTVFASYGRF